jgi:hypothetical protein
MIYPPLIEYAPARLLRMAGDGEANDDLMVVARVPVSSSSRCTAAHGELNPSSAETAALEETDGPAVEID